MRKPVTEDDLRTSVSYAADALATVSDEQWGGTPSNSEWDRQRILRHVTWAVLGYGSLLATKADGPIDFMLLEHRSDPGVYIINRLEIASEVLIQVTRGVEPSTRGWHPTGRPDAEGFLAMACSEVLLHTYDVVRELDNVFEPPDDVVDRVLARLYPWSPKSTCRWQTMLWASSRASLEGHESPGDNWWFFSSPLEDWDGEIYRRPAGYRRPDIGRPLYFQT